MACQKMCLRPPLRATTMLRMEFKMEAYTIKRLLRNGSLSNQSLSTLVTTLAIWPFSNTLMWSNHSNVLSSWTMALPGYQLFSEPDRPFCDQLFHTWNINGYLVIPGKYQPNLTKTRMIMLVLKSCSIISVEWKTETRRGVRDPPLNDAAVTSCAMELKLQL